MVALGKIVTAAVGAGALLALAFPCACTDLRPLGGVASDAGGGPDGGGGPIQVLVWNNALTYGHASRILAIPLLQAREATGNVKFDTTYAHMDANPQDDQEDATSFTAPVFTDQNLDRYDVVLFLNTTGNTIDDDKKAIRRQALQDFIEKKGRGFVGTHSATDTYKADAADPWPWYVDFVGTNWTGHTPTGTSGVAQYFMGMTHPILTAAGTPPMWNRTEEWFIFTRDPLYSPVAGVRLLLTCHDQINGTERPSAWIHEMPLQPGAARSGRMFYTAFGHLTSAFQEPAVMDLIIAGIKWAAGRL